MTTDVQRRFREHKEGKGSHYTRTHGAEKMVYVEECADRSSALKREVAIKKLPRLEKLHLIQMST